LQGPTNLAFPEPSITVDTRRLVRLMVLVPCVAYFLPADKVHSSCPRRNTTVEVHVVIRTRYIRSGLTSENTSSRPSSTLTSLIEPFREGINTAVLGLTRRCSVGVSVL
jgi:hypothetical protein